MPSIAPTTGEMRAITSDGDNTFATLLDANGTNTDAPAASHALATFSTASPVLQLQGIAPGDGNGGEITGVDLAGAANVGAAGVATDASPPSTPSTPSVQLHVIEGAATAQLAADASSPAPISITPQQAAAAVTVAAPTITTIAPAPETGIVTSAEAGIETEVSDPIAESDAGAGEAGAGNAVTILPATSAGATRAITAPVALTVQAPNEASLSAQPAAATPGIAPATDSAESTSPETASANPGGRVSTAQQPNQPAAAAAAQGNTTSPAVDTAAAKPDFASILASQSAQGADAPTQTATGQTGDTARTTPTPAALQAAPAATVQVYNRIIERADGRAQRFEIRLDPAELGRVDVRIEIGADRKVHAVLAAHDSAALSDLMRGQRALERALADAGIDLADNGVRFELARDNGSGGANQQRGSEGRPAEANVWRRFETTAMPVTEEAAAAVRPSWRPQRLDLVA